MIAWAAEADSERKGQDQSLTNFDPETNPAVISGLPNVTFLNPERRVIHLAVRRRGAAKPTWDEVLQTSPGYNQANGWVPIKDDTMLQYAVTISAQSKNGFNINKNMPSENTVYYVVAAEKASVLPSGDFVINHGKILGPNSLGYSFEAVSLKSGVAPTVYFVVKEGTSVSKVFEAKDHAERLKAQANGLDVYYAFEPSPSDQIRKVYLAHTINELYSFQRDHGVYPQLFKTSQTALSGYMNRYWYFVNADRLARNIDPAKYPDLTPSSIQVHLDDAGQEVVADIVAERLAPVIRNLFQDSERPPTCPD